MTLPKNFLTHFLTTMNENYRSVHLADSEVNLWYFFVQQGEFFSHHTKIRRRVVYRLVVCVNCLLYSFSLDEEISLLD